MQFQGERSFSTGPAELWAKLADVRFLVDCIPDATGIASTGPEQARCTVKPGVSFVRGTLEVDVSRGEAVDAQRLSYLIFSKGVGSSAEVVTRMTFETVDAGTKVLWSAEVTKLGGLLKMVPKGLLQAAAQKVIEQVWTGIATRIG